MVSEKSKRFRARSSESFKFNVTQAVEGIEKMENHIMDELRKIVPAPVNLRQNRFSLTDLYNVFMWMYELDDQKIRESPYVQDRTAFLSEGDLVTFIRCEHNNSLGIVSDKHSSYNYTVHPLPYQTKDYGIFPYECLVKVSHVYSPGDELVLGDRVVKARYISGKYRDDIDDDHYVYAGVYAGHYPFSDRESVMLFIGDGFRTFHAKKDQVSKIHTVDGYDWMPVRFKRRLLEVSGLGDTLKDLIEWNQIMENLGENTFDPINMKKLETLVEI
jgi:hypothetical protein